MQSLFEIGIHLHTEFKQLWRDKSHSTFTDIAGFIVFKFSSDETNVNLHKQI